MNVGLHPGFALQLAAVVVPISLYFLVLGILNSRPNPQLLRGRRDFSLLMAALAPLVLVPLLRYLGPVPLTLLAVVVAAAAAIVLLAPRGEQWVIYNLPAEQARQAVERALELAGVEYRGRREEISLPRVGGRLKISPFPLLKNVSIHLEDCPRGFARRFEPALQEVLSAHVAHTSRTAVTLLLVSAVMLAAPLTLLAHRVPEVVRLITHLLP
jgi:hypothetical protein